MSNEAKDGKEGMERGDDEALWRLLGRARTPEASPYFSRRVLREVAYLDDPRAAGMMPGAAAGGWLARWRQAWHRPGAAVWPGAVAVAVFWLSVELTIPSVPAPGGADRYAWPQEMPSAQTDDPTASGDRGGTMMVPAAAAEDAVAAQDVEVIADLDNVIAREENRLWTEDTARF